MAQSSKESTVNAGDHLQSNTQVGFLGGEDPPEKEMAAQVSVLAWEMLRTDWWATVHEVLKSWTQLKD